MSETKERNEEGTPSCEGCGKPTTRKAILSIDVHWRDLADEEGRYDGDSREKYEPLVEQLSDDLCDLVAVVHRRLCIPNWFTREHLEGIARNDVSAEEWGGFLEWLDDTRIPDYMSEQLCEWWGDYRRYKQTQEGDDR
jgi:hypothetical protein